MNTSTARPEILALLKNAPRATNARVRIVVAQASPAFPKSELAEANRICDSWDRLSESIRAHEAGAVSATYRDRVGKHMAAIAAGEKSPDDVFTDRLEDCAQRLAEVRAAAENSKRLLATKFPRVAAPLIKAAAAAVTELRKSVEDDEAAQCARFGVPFEASPVLRNIVAVEARLTERAGYAMDLTARSPREELGSFMIGYHPTKS